jgi:signal transduction histidine kinase
MSASSVLYNFIAVTCILVVVAYLLARGRLLALLFRERLQLGEVILLGLVMGLLGVLEAVFPDVGLPYAPHTLFVIFATIVGGLRVGLTAAGLTVVGAFCVFQTPLFHAQLFQAHLFQRRLLVIPTLLAVLISAFLGRPIRRAQTVSARMAGGFLIGALAQACRLLLRMILTGIWPAHTALSTLWISIPANGFGVALLLLVVSDAQMRAETERARILVAQAQLAALRARIRPHFLFNTLNSIAELCRLDAVRAEAAILRLSQLMHHALETSAADSICLQEESEVARAYLEIEQERLGSRLCVSWHKDARAEQVLVPPFAVQTLAENAIHHGLAPKRGPVTIHITLRSGARHTLVAVRDDGIGMTSAIRQRALAAEDPIVHGLQILNQHLILMYGRRARLRLFSREGTGTLVAFVIPTGALPRARRGRRPC